MRIHYNTHNILLNQHLEGGGGSIANADPLPKGKITNLTQKPSLPVPVPEDVKKITFDAGDENDFVSPDNFDTQQLPPKTETVKKDDKVEKKEIKKEEATPILEDGKEKVVEGLVDDKKAEEPPKKEEKLPSFLKAPKGTVEEKPKEKEVEKAGEPKPLVPPINKVVRDYVGHTPEEVTALKSMSNEGYTLAKKLIQENKELAKLKDSTYLQHEQAYVLDPGFQNLQVDLSFAAKEARYWKEQLVLMDAGKPWRAITGWDDKGNAILGPERAPTKDDEETVRMNMTHCHQQMSELNRQVSGYPEKYKTQTNNDLAIIENERKKQFSWVADEKILDYSMNIDGTDKTFRQIRDDAISLFPVYMRSHPATKVVGDLMIALRYANGLLAEAQNGQAVEQIKAEESGRVEPSTQNRPAKEVKQVHGVTEFSGEPV